MTNKDFLHNLSNENKVKVLDRVNEIIITDYIKENGLVIKSDFILIYSEKYSAWLKGEYRGGI